MRLGETGSEEAHRTASRRWRDELQRVKATRGAGNRAPPPVAFSCAKSADFVVWDPCGSQTTKSASEAALSFGPGVDGLPPTPPACRGASSGSWALLVDP